MEKQFWQTRWQEGKIAFHEGHPNRHLLREFDQLALGSDAHVFVPLCGKTVDLDWLLAQGCRVSGIEWCRDAILAVFERAQRTPEVRRIRDLERFASGGLTLWLGDLFALQPQDLGTVDAVYDRAALVALPQDTRTAYADHMLHLGPTAPHLLIAYDYDQAQTEGPPFCVPEKEIHRLYDGRRKIRRLATTGIEGPLAERCTGQEQAWSLTPVR